MKHLKTYEEISLTDIKKGFIGTALAAGLSSGISSCKVKDNWETIRIEHPDYSPNKGSDFKPGDEISIELPAHSNVKDYTLTITDASNKQIFQDEGELEGPNGTSIYYKVPSKYTDSVMKITLTGKNKLGKDFDPINRVINIVH